MLPADLLKPSAISTSLLVSSLSATYLTFYLTYNEAQLFNAIFFFFLIEVNIDGSWLSC
jgi:hypothetical protein